MKERLLTQATDEPFNIGLFRSNFRRDFDVFDFSDGRVLHSQTAKSIELVTLLFNKCLSLAC
jgi:hypothetical protein